ncbi:MAG TPA: zf-TFIIB domain-containing protein [Pyrinomonadaceae bacterium]|nr:zf-TFIIB domain-containing protein [Pyrinomonadaceae bacterium]
MSIELEDRGRALENEYFRRQEQELIERMKSKISAENAQTSDLDCPKCDGKLIETNFETIKVDVCNNCTGVWLDAGELAQIVGKDENKGWFGRVFG